MGGSKVCSDVYRSEMFEWCNSDIRAGIDGRGTAEGSSGCWHNPRFQNVNVNR